MQFSLTLSIYFARQFLIGFGIVLSVLAAVVIVFDIAELMRRGLNRDSVSYFVILEMSALQLPFLLQKVLPIVALFGGMLTFLRLTRTHQLVVARGAGVSVWQFIAPALFVASSIGAFSILVFDPIAAAAISRFEQLEGRYLRGQASFLAVSENGLWLRQSNSSGQSVIHAVDVRGQGEELRNVTIFLYRGPDTFDSRIDANIAILRPGFWDLQEVLLTGPDLATKQFASYRLETTMTLAQIQDSFAPPQTLSFWELPGFISTLQEAGFSALNHRIHWHSLLSIPLLLFAMVLIAASFSLRIARQGNVGPWVVAGVLAGFVIYVVSDVMVALSLSGSVPVFFAAWTPAGVCVLLGTTALFHLEDG